MAGPGGTARRTAEAAHALALLYVAGAALVAVTLVLPVGLWPDANVPVLAGAVAFTGVGGGVLLLLARRDRLPRLLPLVGVVLGALDITVVAYGMGDTGSIAASTFYAFATGYAFYYLPEIQAVGVTAVAGAGYAVVVWQLAPTAPGAQWLLTIGPAAVAGWVIGGLARERLATELRLADELRHADENRTLFLRAISHDMRVPLMTVEGAAETLVVQDGRLSAADREQLLALLGNATGRLRRLLDDLLTLDRLRSGQVRLNREPTDVNELVVTLVSRDFADTPVTVRTTAPVQADVDRAGVEHAVRNLVANACKYGPEDGLVLVSVHDAPGQVTVSVEDHGPGVADEEKERVFAPFTRGKHVDGRPGTGVGLSVVRSFARLHGGDVYVEDRPGGGARFVLELPRS